MFFDIGFWEILIVGIVSLVVLGPERLPAAARTAGHYVGKLQRFLTGVRSEFQNELQSGELHNLIGDQKRQIDELRHLVQDTKDEFQRSASSVTDELSSTTDTPSAPAAKASTLSLDKSKATVPNDTPSNDSAS